MPSSGLPRSSTVIRSASGTRGTGAVSIDRMITCSCSTWLWSTLARIASGGCLPRLRKIAVPGMRDNFCARRSHR